MSTDVVTNPDNYTMNYTNFQMAVRPFFQQSTHLDMRRYFRVYYGEEVYTWNQGKLEITLENNEGIQCNRDIFVANDLEWE